jgi:hypothetical protein
MHYSRRLFLALAAGCGLSTLTLRSAHAQTPRPAARDAPDLKSLIAKATRLSVLSDRITRSQVQRSLGVLASRADRVLADSTQEARKLLTELAASNTAAATRSQISAASQAYDGLLKASEKLSITDRPALAQFARLADDVGEAVDKVVELLIKDSAQPMAGILSTTADLQRLTPTLGRALPSGPGRCRRKRTAQGSGPGPRRVHQAHGRAEESQPQDRPDRRAAATAGQPVDVHEPGARFDRARRDRHGTCLHHQRTHAGSADIAVSTIRVCAAVGSENL